MYKSIIFLLLLFFGSHILYAQRINTTNNNLWIVYSGDHKLSEKFGAHIEYQERRNDLGKKNMQHLFRAGINYHFLHSAFATLGYAFVETYPYGEFAVKCNFPEHRIYQQLQYTTNLGRVEAISRFRLEQRFSYLPTIQADSTCKSSSSTTYTNRFRFFQRFSIPFTGKTIKDNSFYFTANNEFFINFGKNVQQNIFDQNRAFAGIGYKVSKLGRIELGYLNQILFRNDGVRVEYNNTLSVSLIANFAFPSYKATN